MTLQDLGSIGEFVAAIATLATLVYLALQIRQNTREAQAASRNSVSQSFIDLLIHISRDSETTKLVRIPRYVVRSKLEARANPPFLKALCL